MSGDIIKEVLFSDETMIKTYSVLQSISPENFNEYREMRKLAKANRGIHRIIAEQIEDAIDINDEKITLKLFIILDVLKKGTPDYTDYFDTNNRRTTLPLWYKKNQMNTKIKEKIINNYKEELKSRMINSKDRKTKPTLTKNLHQLHNMQLHEVMERNETYIYETNSFSKKMKADKMRVELKSINQTIQKIAVDKFAVNTNIQYEPIIESKLDLCYIKKIIDYSNFKMKAIILIDVDFNDIFDKTNMERKYGELLKDNTKADSLSKISAKSYPWYLLENDNGEWQNIALSTNSSTNLALSTEELNILLEPSYPSFIQGRAGSGKSTILDYSFFYRYLDCIKYEIGKQEFLFLTFNEHLKSVAIDRISELFKFNSEAEKYNLNELIEYDEFRKQIFYTIKDYLIREIMKYNEKYIRKEFAFQDFKEFYMGIYEKNIPSAETCWHVIRTFIKGHDKDSELSPNDYNKIRTGKSVSNSDYKKIYNTVYMKYKDELTEQKRWDYIDLIKDSLKYMETSKSPYKQYHFIFCDEAQDFTKLEFELIYKLSIFSRYNLEECRSIPILFAGDEMQTINPTGFKWNNIQSIFMENVIKEYKNSEIELTPKNLDKNYRSSKSIVGFANQILLYRKKMTDNNVVLQESWDDRDIPPLLIIVDDLKDRRIDTVLETLDDHVIIMPDNDKNEEEIKEKMGEVNNLMDVKGSEYPNVIIMYFGERYGELFKKYHDKENDDIDFNEDVELQIEAMMSAIYVSATRAKEQLIIIDTKKGYDKLWKYFTADNSLFSEAEFERPISYGKKATDEEIFELKLSETEKKTLAETIKQEAIMKCSVKKMQDASRRFEKLGLKKEANECKAKAEEFQDHYSAAGDLYLLIEEYDDALECFWRNGDLNEIVSKLKNYGELHADIRYIISQELVNSSINKIISSAELRNQLKNIIEKENIEYIQNHWQQILKEIHKQIDNEMINEENLEFIYLLREYHHPFRDLIANYYFDNKKYLELTDFISSEYDFEDQYPKTYWEALLNIGKDIEDKIKALYFLKNWEQLLKLLDERDINIDNLPDIKSYIIESLKKVENLKNYTELIIKLKPIEQLNILLIRSKNYDDDKMIYEKIIRDLTIKLKVNDINRIFIESDEFDTLLTNNSTYFLSSYISKPVKEKWMLIYKLTDKFPIKDYKKHTQMIIDQLIEDEANDKTTIKEIVDRSETELPYKIILDRINRTLKDDFAVISRKKLNKILFIVEKINSNDNLIKIYNEVLNLHFNNVENKDKIIPERLITAYQKSNLKGSDKIERINKLKEKYKIERSKKIPDAIELNKEKIDIIANFIANNDIESFNNFPWTARTLIETHIGWQEHEMKYNGTSKVKKIICSDNKKKIGIINFKNKISDIEELENNDLDAFIYINKNGWRIGIKRRNSYNTKEFKKEYAEIARYLYNNFRKG